MERLAHLCREGLKLPQKSSGKASRTAFSVHCIHHDRRSHLGNREFGDCTMGRILMLNCKGQNEGTLFFFFLRSSDIRYIHRFHPALTVG